MSMPSRLTCIALFILVAGCYQSNASEGADADAADELAERADEVEIDDTNDAFHEDELDGITACDLRLLDDAIVVAEQRSLFAARNSQVASSGDTFAVLFQQEDARLSIFTPGGEKLVDGAAISSSGTGSGAWAAFTGSEYGIQWVEAEGNPEVDERFLLKFARFSTAGDKMSADATVHETGYPAGIGGALTIFTGDAFTALWLDGRDYIYEFHLLPYDLEGTPLSAERLVMQTGLLGRYEAAFSGEGFAIVFSPEVMDSTSLARISRTGDLLSDVKPLLNCSSTDIVFADDRYAIACAWGGNIFLKFLSLEGDQVGDAVTVSSEPAGLSTDPVIVYTGTEYGIAWNTNAGMIGDLRFERVLPDGTMVGSEMIVFDQFLNGRSLDISYAGDVYALTFDNNSSVYLVLVGCDQT